MNNTLHYNKIKAFLKLEDKCETYSTNKSRLGDHPNGYEKLVGTSSAFYIIPSAALTEINHTFLHPEDTVMAQLFAQKEKLEPIAQLTPTGHLFEVPHWKSPSNIYRRLDYTGGDGNTYSVWVDRRFLDILDPDFSNLRDYYGVWKIELVEPNIVRVKKGSEYQSLADGKKQMFETVMYCGRGDLKGEELK